MQSAKVGSMSPVALVRLRALGVPAQQSPARRRPRVHLAQFLRPERDAIVKFADARQGCNRRGIWFGVSRKPRPSLRPAPEYVTTSRSEGQSERHAVRRCSAMRQPAFLRPFVMAAVALASAGASAAPQPLINYFRPMPIVGKLSTTPAM